MNDENKNKFTLTKKQIILIAVPALIILTGAILFSKISQLHRMREETEALQNAALTAVSDVSVQAETVSPDAETEDGTALVALGLTAGSSGSSLHAAVIAPADSVPEGYVYPVIITFPDGTERTYTTDGDGTLSVTGLAEGTYYLSISPMEGFDTSCSISCTVSAIEEETYSYVPIENISQQAVVSQSSDAPSDEARPASADSTAVAAEVIITSTDTDQTATGSGAGGSQSTGTVIVGGTSPDEPYTAPASSGKIWKYTCETGPNGNVLKSDGTESDVFPVLENGNLSYGLRKITTYFDASGQIIASSDLPEDAVEGSDYFYEESSEYVTLILGNGQVNTDYMIHAEETAEETTVVSGWQEIDGKLYYLDSTGTRVTGLKNIDGKLYFFNSDGSKKGNLGVDVSYWNHDINFYAVKNNGIDFAIVRVGYRGYESGILYEDGNSYKEMDWGGCYLQEAVAAGLEVGVYFYSSATTTNEAVEEASLAIEVLKASGVTPTYPVYIDMEDSGMFPNGRADKLTDDERAEIINAFCLTVSAAGYKPGLYCSELYYKYRINTAALTDCELWIANYTENYTLPGVTGWDLWQFTGSAMVNGIAGGSDLSVLPDP